MDEAPAPTSASLAGRSSGERDDGGRADRILQQIGDGLVVVDRDLRVVDVNPAAERLLSTPRARLVGRSHSEAFPGSADEEPERQYRRLLAEGGEAHFTHHYADAGRDFHAEVDAYPTDEGGVAIFWRDVSARVRAEAALRESEARFRTMADAVPQVVWITDGEGRAEFFNRQWTAYTGRPYEPTTAADVAATAVHPDDAAITMERFEEARRTGRTFQVEHRIRSASGEYRWFLVRAEPYRDPATGRVVRWFGSSTDIHDRKLAEEALRASEERYRTLFASIDDGFCVIEVLFDGEGPDARPVDYRFLEANPAFEVQTGLVDAVGRTVRAMVPSHEAYWFDIYGRVATTGEPRRFEERAAALGRIYEVYAFRVGAPADRRVAVLFRDVSPAKAAEAERARLLAELEAERELLRALIRDVPAPVALQLGPEHRFALLSDAFKHVSGGRDLTGMTPQEAYPEVVGTGILERFDEVVATGRPWVSRETYARFDRRGQGVEDTWFDIRYQPVRDAAGRVIGVLNFSLDVTEQVRARRAVEDLLSVSEGARHDAETARAEAEAANRAKGEFLAVMSHQLRTPLNAIGGYAELIELGIRGPVTDAQRADLARIQQSQRHLLGLINQVLNYTRVDAGAVLYAPTDVRICDALAAAEALVLPQARTRGLRLVLGDCPTGLVARADRDKLQQILLNLLSNAVKFTESGGEVRVTCAGRGGQVEISVADTGVGIGAEKLPSIFEPFVQVDQRLTRPHDGVGLGLAISRELARGMGGELTAESVVGEGSRFTLTLPRA